MKTKPFSASSYDPARDKLVCGGDPVTELIVGDSYVAGVLTTAEGERFILRWDRTTGMPIDFPNDDAPLEVLTPEPEKPREWWVKLSMIGLITEGVQRVPRDDVLASKARGWHLVREVLDPEEAKAVETTEGQRQAADDKEVSCEGTSSGLVATVGKSSPSTHIGYVPLHNGVPQWNEASKDPGLAKDFARRYDFTGPVEPCIVKPKPMTRDEAQALVDRRFKNWLESDRNQIVDALLEAANEPR